jgi:kynurenine 3-monooxygenase
MDKKESVLIVGAGLCGSLQAIMLAQKAYKVKLFEKRPDMRDEELVGGRSINLALSNRGISALQKVGLAEEVKALCIPMYGRQLHLADGTQRFSKYSGRDDEYINSISREGLNILLLDKVESYSNVELVFDNECKEIDLENGEHVFFDHMSKTMEHVYSDICFGTDGAGSIVRRSMIGKTTSLLFDYSQSFLRHGYKELSIPPAEDGGWRIEKNALHIWPRGAHMLIALPNLDGSFTVTMFNPYEGKFGFDSINTEEEIMHYFRSEFPDVIEHIPNLVQDYRNNPVGTLGTIKCYPWQAYGKNCLLGDAAHAIVPFYGQGMNASLEDVKVFSELMDKGFESWGELLQNYQDLRKPNADAIADLALDNFYEMKDHVSQVDFIQKRILEMKMEQQYPDYYSKYALVTFREDLSYREAMILGRKQDELLLELCKDKEAEDLNLDEVYAKVKELYE